MHYDWDGDTFHGCGACGHEEAIIKAGSRCPLCEYYYPTRAEVYEREVGEDYD